MLTRHAQFAVDVNHRQNAGHFFHAADAIEVAGDLATLTHELAGHLLGVGVDFTKSHKRSSSSRRPAVNGAEVGEDATEPSFTKGMPTSVAYLAMESLA